MKSEPLMWEYHKYTDTSLRLKFLHIFPCKIQYPLYEILQKGIEVLQFSFPLLDSWEKKCESSTLWSSSTTAKIEWNMLVHVWARSSLKTTSCLYSQISIRTICHAYVACQECSSCSGRCIICGTSTCYLRLEKQDLFCFYVAAWCLKCL